MPVHKNERGSKYANQTRRDGVNPISGILLRGIERPNSSPLLELALGGQVLLVNKLFALKFEHREEHYGATISVLRDRSLPVKIVTTGNEILYPDKEEPGRLGVIYVWTNPERDFWIGKNFRVKVVPRDDGDFVDNRIRFVIEAAVPIIIKPLPAETDFEQLVQASLAAIVPARKPHAKPKP